MRRRLSVKLVVLMMLVAGIILIAVFSKWLCPYDPNEQNLAVSLASPSFEHWMGTDIYGRDMLSRVIAGSKVSILSTLTVVCIILMAGSTAGILCGYFGGALDTVMMRISDLFLAFPSLVAAMAVAALLQDGISGAVLSLAVVSWPKYARLARSRVLSLKEEPYIDAAKLAGDTSFQIIVRHILPNIAGTLIVTAVMDMGTVMMEIAGLSFLGLGAQPPMAEWGSMMSNGRSMLLTYPWVVLGPGVAIFFCAAVFNLFGDAMREWLDREQEDKG